VIELARDSTYYTECGVADSIAGRFDMITAVLSAVMVRVEASELRSESALLAELFVEDMDGQLREFGVNDVVVGKRIGRLMSVLGGRLGAYRSALNAGDLEKLTGAIQRNVTFAEGADEAASAQAVAARVMKLFERLGRYTDTEMMKASAIW
jgi:cytochrome b pre-mRNA-processing protein 3